MAENYVSTNMDTGVQVKEALERINAYHPDLFAWSEISDSVTVNLKSPTSYSGIKDPGDYVIYKFSNGPSKIPSTLSPILLSLRNGKKYVSANGVVYTLDSSGNNWIDVNDSVDDDTIIYVRSDTAPTRTNNTFWFDTSNYDGTSDGYIELKYYDTDTNSWASVFNETNYLKKSTLDPTGKNTDIYAYITNQIANVLGDYGEFIKHKANQLTLIHVTADDRAQYAKIITEAELRDLINNTYKAAIKNIIDDSVSAELDTTQLERDTTSLENSYKSHLENHITADNIAAWRNKADANHTHDYTSGDVKIQGSQVVSGIFTDDQLPDEIKERYYKLTDTAENTFSNTSITDADRKSKYHNGNAFYYETTDDTTRETVRKWYRIIDSSKVGTSSWADGVVDFTGKKANMDWNNVTGRPTTLEEFGIANTLYTKTEVDEKFKVYNDQVTSMNKTLAECEENTGYEYGIKPIWTEITISDTSRQWSSVCYGNDKFVAVASNTNYFAYSTDGINWTEGTISSTSRNWYSVCYGNGKFVVVGNYSNYFAYSTDGINWTEGILPSSRQWTPICYGNDKFVAVAGNNSVCFIYSTDGINWTESRVSDTSRQWSSVCYGNDKFVAVARNSNYFAYSTDGINWTENTISDTSRDWGPVCYGNDKFVAVAYHSNYFAYSTDGITWTEEIRNDVNSWNSIYYGNEMFVAVGGGKAFAYSTDGINWIEGIISSTNRNWRSVCYGNGKFVAVAWTNNSNYFAYAPDSLLPMQIDRIGIQYKTQELFEFDDTMTGTIPQLDCIIKTTDGKIYKTTYNKNSTYLKADGTTYTTTNSPEPLGATMLEKIMIEEEIKEGDLSDRYWHSVCYGNDKFVAVAHNSNLFAYSTDGITWTKSVFPNRGYWKSICYGNGKFVAVADYWSGGAEYAYSTDGINWTEGHIASTDENPPQTWESVCYGNGKFVAVASNTDDSVSVGHNLFAYSTDGINWNIVDVSCYNWSSVCYGNDKYVAVGYNTNYFAYSTDGINWTEGTISDTSRNWHSVCYGNGKFVAVASSTNIFAYSTDGITWTEGTISSTSRDWQSVCYGNGKFVAVGSGNYFTYSTDGINWTEGTISSTYNTWTSVCYGNGKYVAVGFYIKT